MYFFSMSGIFIILMTFSSFFSTFATDILPQNDSYPRCLQIKERQYIEHIDLDGSYPELEFIDIDAIRKKRVDFFLTGDFPALQEILYRGSFGLLKGTFSGEFPLLNKIMIACGSSEMKLNFVAPWQRDCLITVTNKEQDMHITCPSNVGVIIHTKVSWKGKVKILNGLQQKSRGLCRKTFQNKLVGSSPILLTFNLESHQGGTIFLNVE
ncbi:Uncharacterized protein CLAVI_000632 [Candidatus Clavichlamydia salmonicola]|uniref:hypothetical protein n=1 Tax=Candidatus Clavichlamydia salmonicola TaxID=469812 RepID=UPI00189189EF|nr:hypothetical protein [Candidatus Clavichlamydia salmonicola]MBF5051007.1 Uncharacterized protein [Candidatus Clavichlamydia salmonicola]